MNLVDEVEIVSLQNSLKKFVKRWGEMGREAICYPKEGGMGFGQRQRGALDRGPSLLRQERGACSLGMPVHTSFLWEGRGQGQTKGREEVRWVS